MATKKGKAKAQALCQAHALEALERMVEVMRQKEDLRAAVEAARLILAYGYGQPVQTVQLDSMARAALEDAIRGAICEGDQGKAS
jgi:aromatic ring hydroxylase